MIPKDVLVAAYVDYIFKEAVKAWLNTGCLNETAHITGNEKVFVPFCRPSKSRDTDQMEIKVNGNGKVNNGKYRIHIHTNLRGAICRNSILVIDRNSWLKVAENGKTPFLQTMIEVQADGKVLDQQNESFAGTMFCKEVENCYAGNCRHLWNKMYAKA